MASKPVRNATLFLIFWLFPLAWVALTPPITAPFHPATHTRQRLGVNNKALHQFLERFKKTPLDLNMLHAFAVGEKLPFHVFDAFGQRMDYLRLDAAHYLMRSYGEDGEQNTITSSPDMGVVRWGKLPEVGVTYKYPNAPVPDLYPAILLDGADSPDHQWLARLYTDPEAKTRQLLVRHRTKAGTFMVARHDAVEQFLWLPGGKQLVFTASGSTRLRDGLYLWNLGDDSLVNLVDSAGQNLPLSPSARALSLWMMLAGVAKTADDAVVYMYYWPRHDGGLDPAEFFVRDQVFAVDISQKAGVAPRALPNTTLPKSFDALPIETPLSFTDQLDGLGGIKSQQEWLKLETSGELEKVLLSWHQFSEQQTRSSLFPYGLWILSALYSQSFQIMAGEGSQDADVLRTFGTEIARAIITDPVAPMVLKGLALFSYENLMEGDALPYRLGELKRIRAAVKDLPAPPPTATPVEDPDEEKATP